MLARCHNPKAPDFHRYGGRGILVCASWKVSFLAFLRDMGMRPDGKTLDRINNSNGYCKENCRWATVKLQHRNTRQNKFLTYQGETLTMTEWAERSGIKYKALKQRIRNGWPVERALTERVFVGRRAQSIYRKFGQRVPLGPFDGEKYRQKQLLLGHE